MFVPSTELDATGASTSTIPGEVATPGDTTAPDEMLPCPDQYFGRSIDPASAGQVIRHLADNPNLNPVAEDASGYEKSRLANAVEGGSAGREVLTTSDLFCLGEKIDPDTGKIDSRIVLRLSGELVLADLIETTDVENLADETPTTTAG